MIIVVIVIIIKLLLLHVFPIFGVHYFAVMSLGGGGTPYIRMIGMIVVFFRGCNRRFGIF